MTMMIFKMKKTHPVSETKKHLYMRGTRGYKERDRGDVACGDVRQSIR